jgi:hypothetical protein
MNNGLDGWTEAKLHGVAGSAVCGPCPVCFVLQTGAYFRYKRTKQMTQEINSRCLSWSATKISLSTE